VIESGEGLEGESAAGECVYSDRMVKTFIPRDSCSNVDDRIQSALDSANILGRDAQVFLHEVTGDYLRLSIENRLDVPMTSS